MADVTDGRGQLILVTGLLIAVAMVSLVLLLNTAIFTENLASRGADQSGREAVEYQATVVESVSGVLEAENRREHGSWTAVEENVTAGVDLVDNYTARSYATGGTVVRINDSTVDPVEGRLIRQTSSRPFRNESGTRDDWRMAQQVEDDEIRNFAVTVDRSSLETNDADGFNVHLDDGGDTWQAHLYDTGSEVAVGVSTDGGSITQVCTKSGSEATVDFTRGTIDGETCPGLRWSEGISNPYEVRFENGENATGTYNVTIQAPGGATIDSTNVSPNPSDPVYEVPAVYSTEFNVSYTSPTLDYRSEVRVAPGESE